MFELAEAALSVPFQRPSESGSLDHQSGPILPNASTYFRVQTPWSSMSVVCFLPLPLAERHGQSFLVLTT